MFYNKTTLKNLFVASVVALGFTACSDDDEPKLYDIVSTADVPSGYTIQSQTINFTELNSQTVTTVSSLVDLELPAGTYNIDGTATATAVENGQTVEKNLRTVAQNVEISENTPSINLKWFFYNPDNSLVLSEIYVSGSLNATGKSTIYDTYFRIYNNTDEVIYADGIALVESQMKNTGNNQEIKTPEALPENNFTIQTVYVIPGNGTEHPIQPGQSIKIADQAIDWTETITPALNHTDADFEWFDLVTTGKIRDTDNQAVENLDKWFSYSLTIWIPNSQCITSFALVRFPAGMTAEKLIAEYPGEYEYINTKTNTEMTQKNCLRIPNDWVIDGVNLCSSSTYLRSALASSIDMSYASIAEDNAVANRAGKKFVRKVAGTSPAGNTILMDTNDSANDFSIVSAYN